jgi:hypothetical protein
MAEAEPTTISTEVGQPKLSIPAMIVKVSEFDMIVI